MEDIEKGGVIQRPGLVRHFGLVRSGDWEWSWDLAGVVVWAGVVI
jgi:hypothetical protein